MTLTKGDGRVFGYPQIVPHVSRMLAIFLLALMLIPMLKATSFGLDTYNYTAHPVTTTNGIGPSIFYSNVGASAVSANTVVNVNPNIALTINSVKMKAFPLIAFYNSTGHFSTNGLMSKPLGIYTYNAEVTGNVIVSIQYNGLNPLAGSLAPFMLENGAWVRLNSFTNNQITNTITFTAPSDPTFALDGTNSVSINGPAAASLSTTTTNDVIIAEISFNTNPTTVTMSDASKKITWISSNTVPIIKKTGAFGTGSLWVFVGVANAILSSDLITETSSGTPTTMQVMAITGANTMAGTASWTTSNILDLTALTSNSNTNLVSSQTSNTFSTSNANDMIFYFVAESGTTSNTPVAGLIGGASSTLTVSSPVQSSALWGFGEYLAVTSIKSSITAAMSWTGTVKPSFGTLAVQQAPPSGGSTTTLTATPNPYSWASTNSLAIGSSVIGNTVISNGYTGTTSYTGNIFIYPPASSNIAAWNTIPWALPANNALTFTVNYFAANELQMTYNSITYNTIATGTNVIAGQWTFNMMAGDANRDASPSPIPTNIVTFQATTTSTTTSTSTTTTILPTCGITASNTLVNFGTIGLGLNVATGNLIVASNTGNTASNILIEYTTNWAGMTDSTRTYSGSNTVWSANLNTAYASATPLTASFVDTLIVLPAGSSNNIYLGSAVPNNNLLTPQSYNSVLLLETSC